MRTTGDGEAMSRSAPLQGWSFLLASKNRSRENCGGLVGKGGSATNVGMVCQLNNSLPGF